MNQKLTGVEVRTGLVLLGRRWGGEGTIFAVDVVEQMKSTMSRRVYCQRNEAQEVLDV